ncbi:MAG: hypothetical protein ACI9SC_001153 [Gammaproteobacteria bacterium]|jgi:hypothetical protein
MTKKNKDPASWAIHYQPKFPDELLTQAREHQSSLLKGLVDLRKLRFDFHRSIEPDAARLWIEKGRKHTE